MKPVKRYVKVLAAGTLLGTQSLPGYVSVAGAQVTQMPPVTVTGTSSGSSGGCGSSCNSYGGFYSSGGSSSSSDVPENEAYGYKPAPPPPPKPKPDPQKIARCDADYSIAADRTTMAYGIALNACVSGRSAQPPAYANGWYSSCVKDADDRKTMQQAADKSAREKCLAEAGG